MQKFMISGFSDEIDADLETQLRAVRELGMEYICLRGVNGKNICEYTPAQVKQQIKPLLDKYGVKVSSIGSPLGKVFADDPVKFECQLQAARRVVEIARYLECRYVRIFSFYIPQDSSAEHWREPVLEKLRALTEIFAAAGITALHENEKDIYGDTAMRCLDLFQAIDSPYFRGIFDFANFVQCREDVLGGYRILRPYIDYFHIKDAVRAGNINVLCGTGEGRIEEILADAWKRGFSGFLTLEPHLVLFESLQSLELHRAEDVIKQNLYEDGKTGFAAQYQALVEILSRIQAPAAG